VTLRVHRVEEGVGCALYVLADGQNLRLRKLVRHARSPKHNLLLRHPEMPDPLLKLFREKYESRGGVWDPQREATLKSLIDKCVDIIEGKNQDNS